MTELIVVQTTTETKEQAADIAQALVEARLAACVQIGGPIESCFRWEDKTTTSAEWLVTIKTRRALYERAEETIRRVHAYAVPEIVATPVVTASAAYAAWVEAQTQSS